MKNRVRLRSALGKALVLGALLTVTVSGTAYANTVAVTVKTPGATSGPTTIDSEISTHADCASGLVSGGGVTTTDFMKTGSGGPHLNGSFPSDSAGNPVRNGVAGPSYWTAVAHAGGSPAPNSYTDGWALCLNAHRKGEGEDEG
ncbi:hypothetical protein [Streptomyces sp. CT34]|uniref:hypothetical protein n=1 Tax=Streptomyces sp. CT34 TaxID=1553907 RepID=UPI0005BD715C|nr:hypothetical protein [Streptomyces sp. CT34]